MTSQADGLYKMLRIFTVCELTVTCDILIKWGSGPKNQLNKKRQLFRAGILTL